jgi:hypothetical protein
MRHEELLARMSKGTEAASGTPFGLVAKPFAEEIWMVKEFRSAMAKSTTISV